jgi:ATP-binding cassette subfamily B multidrug efflux pump
MGSNRFALVDAGFNDLMRPSMYGAHHGISVLPADGPPRPVRPTVVAGPLCESGDVFTQGEGGVVLDARTAAGRRWAICWCSTMPVPTAPACPATTTAGRWPPRCWSGNFPMRLRWNFHRLMLGQSMAFYQDEFAGRIATKVMQTALAVRDTWLIVTDILVYVLIYFVTMLAVVGGFDLWLMLPFLGWLALYVRGAALLRAAPGQGGAGAGRRALADDRPHHRRLHQHRHRQAVLARAARGRPSRAARCRSSWSRPTARCGWSRLRDRQPGAERGLIAAPPGVTLWLWTQGQVGVGAVAAATAMALRLNGISHWVMWEMASLFEHIGTVQDGMATLSRARMRSSTARRPAAEVPRGEVRFEQVASATAARAR